MSKMWRIVRSLAYLLIYCALVLCCGEQTDISKLPHRDFDLLDSFVRIILKTNRSIISKQD